MKEGNDREVIACLQSGVKIKYKAADMPILKLWPEVEVIKDISGAEIFRREADNERIND